MNRRRFVKALPMLSAGAASAGGLGSLSACATVPYVAATGSGSEARVPAAQIPPGTGAFVTTPNRPWPLYVHRHSDQRVTAVAASCTHQGCQPDPQGGRLVCPCHGSQFDLDGALLEGPAEAPLPGFPASVDGTDVVIRLDGQEER